MSEKITKLNSQIAISTIGKREAILKIENTTTGGFFALYDMGNSSFIFHNTKSEKTTFYRIDGHILNGSSIDFFVKKYMEKGELGIYTHNDYIQKFCAICSAA